MAPGQGHASPVKTRRTRREQAAENGQPNRKGYCGAPGAERPRPLALLALRATVPRDAPMVKANQERGDADQGA